MEEDRSIVQYECPYCLPIQTYNNVYDLKEHMYDQHEELIFDHECGAFAVVEEEMPDGKSHRNFFSN